MNDASSGCAVIGCALLIQAAIWCAGIALAAYIVKLVLFS